MRTLMGKSAALCMAIAAQYVAEEPSFADAAALAAGRLHLWSGWQTLAPEDRLIIARFIRFRPHELAQPSAFLEEAESLLRERAPLFEITLRQATDASGLKETDRYRVVKPLEPARIIAELLDAISSWRSEPHFATLPEQGEAILKQFTSETVRVFSLPAEVRPRFRLPAEALKLRVAPGTGTARWLFRDLEQSAVALDAAQEVHCSHLASLKRLLGSRPAIETHPGEFYRVNAPTASGKSVVMLLMALDAARRGMKVTIAVPSLVDVRNTVHALKESAKVLGYATKVAPLHSQARIAEMAERYFVDAQQDHPYHYTCLLDAFASDDSCSDAGKEPCFNLHVPSHKSNGNERTRRIDTCPFIFRCGKATMLEQVLDADIVVVNHHALLSGSTRIPVSGTSTDEGAINLIEILLRQSQIFLVDEIDGLLQSAISTSVFDLELGSRQTTTLLSKLRRQVEFPNMPIPDMKPASIIRASWALAYCTLMVNELLDLHANGYFDWPMKETTWPTADDGLLTDKLQIDRTLLDHLFDPQKDVPRRFRDLQNNLSYWARHDGTRSPEVVALELQLILGGLAERGSIAPRTKPKEREKIKAALLLRGRLTFLEQQLRNLQRDLPALIRANVENAYEVQQALKGPEPVSPTPNGPLHRTVYGFKRHDSEREGSMLHVIAMRGDPHRTLLALPGLTALSHAGVERIFVGFSATAYFPGASNFDLPAKDLVDVPDLPGYISFEHVSTTVAVSGAPLYERSNRVRALAKELWPWLRARLAKLQAAPETMNRARLLLVTNSDDDAEELASSLYGLSDGPGTDIVLVRSSDTDVGAHRLPREQRMTYAELVTFAQGPHAARTLLVSSILPMSRGHNIVNANGESAIGGIVVCVRPLPSSDRPGNNLAHICYETGNTVLPSPAPGEGLIAERKMANAILYMIRNSSPAFSQQPANIRHYTIMNILVALTQLLGRARRGGTTVTCYLADAAFFDGKTTWANLLDETVSHLKSRGEWKQFARHHAALANALINYISTCKPEVA